MDPKVKVRRLCEAARAVLFNTPWQSSNIYFSELNDALRALDTLPRKGYVEVVNYESPEVLCMREEKP